MTTENLFVNPSNPLFQKNFCEDSDVFTLMSAIIEVMEKEGLQMISSLDLVSIQ